MFTVHCALSSEQARVVWKILEHRCGLMAECQAQERFVDAMTDPACCGASHAWPFVGSRGQRAVFRFPGMFVTSAMKSPAESWISMLMRANEDLREILPNGETNMTGSIGRAAVQSILEHAVANEYAAVAA